MKKNKKLTLKTKTCCDCIKHICSSICSPKNKLCDGFCKVRNNWKTCYGEQCEKYKIDEEFYDLRNI